MLVLTRCEDEAIRIGDDIEIVVLSIGRSRTRIGIRAPRDMAIRRARPSSADATGDTESDA